MRTTNRSKYTLGTVARRFQDTAEFNRINKGLNRGELKRHKAVKTKKIVFFKDELIGWAVVEAWAMVAEICYLIH